MKKTTELIALGKRLENKYAIPKEYGYLTHPWQLQQSYNERHPYETEEIENKKIEHDKREYNRRPTPSYEHPPTPNFESFIQKSVSDIQNILSIFVLLKLQRNLTPKEMKIEQWVKNLLIWKQDQPEEKERQAKQQKEQDERAKEKVLQKILRDKKEKEQKLQNKKEKEQKLQEAQQRNKDFDLGIVPTYQQKKKQEQSTIFQESEESRRWREERDQANKLLTNK